MRLVIKAGLVPDRPDPLVVSAEASDEANPFGRWVAANLDVRTIIAVGGVAAALFGVHAETKSHLAAVDKQIEADHALIVETRETQARTNQRLTRDYVERPDIDNAIRKQIYAVFLEAGVMQLRAVPRSR